MMEVVNSGKRFYGMLAETMSLLSNKNCIYWHKKEFVGENEAFPHTFVCKR